MDNENNEDNENDDENQNETDEINKDIPNEEKPKKSPKSIDLSQLYKEMAENLNILSQYFIDFASFKLSYRTIFEESDIFYRMYNRFLPKIKIREKINENIIIRLNNLKTENENEIKNFVETWNRIKINKDQSNIGAFHLSMFRLIFKLIDFDIMRFFMIINNSEKGVNELKSRRYNLVVADNENINDNTFLFNLKTQKFFFFFDEEEDKNKIELDTYLLQYLFSIDFLNELGLEKGFSVEFNQYYQNIINSNNSNLKSPLTLEKYSYKVDNNELQFVISQSESGKNKKYLETLKRSKNTLKKISDSLLLAEGSNTTGKANHENSKFQQPNSETDPLTGSSGKRRRVGNSRKNHKYKSQNTNEITETQQLTNPNTNTSKITPTQQLTNPSTFKVTLASQNKNKKQKRKNFPTQQSTNPNANTSEITPTPPSTNSKPKKNNTVQSLFPQGGNNKNVTPEQLKSNNQTDDIRTSPFETNQITPTQPLSNPSLVEVKSHTADELFTQRIPADQLKDPETPNGESIIEHSLISSDIPRLEASVEQIPTTDSSQKKRERSKNKEFQLTENDKKKRKVTTEDRNDVVSKMFEDE